MELIDYAIYTHICSGIGYSRVPAMAVCEYDSQIISIVQSGAFALMLQPVFMISENRIESFEALVRFGADVEKETGLSVEETVTRIEQLCMHEQFDLRVIGKCCEIIVDARNKGQVLPKLAINLCSATLGSEYFPNKLNQVLDSFNVSPTEIVLEVTERSYVSNLANLYVIPKLVGDGYQFAIDDFISGYSNFAALTSSTADIVKIDSSVALSLSHSQIARQFSRGILNLIEALGKRVVFEGVETLGQYLYLQAIGSPSIQGHFISKPMAPGEISAFQREMHRRIMLTVFDLEDAQGGTGTKLFAFGNSGASTI